MNAVDNWRSMWQLDMSYAETTPDSLIRDMADIHVDVKLRAIVTCARVPEFLDQHVHDTNGAVKYTKLLPDRLFVALECCLDDEHDRVRRSAAIALYVLNRPSDKVIESSRRTQLCAIRLKNESMNVK